MSKKVSCVTRGRSFLRSWKHFPHRRNRQISPSLHNVLLCTVLGWQLEFTNFRATTLFFQKTQNPIKSQIGHQLARKYSRLKSSYCFTGVPNFILISQAVYELSGCQTLKIGHTRTQTHTSGRQLRITFLDVLDYSDTNISKFSLLKYQRY